MQSTPDNLNLERELKKVPLSYREFELTEIENKGPEMREKRCLLFFVLYSIHFNPIQLHRSRMKTELKITENYSELAGGSSYRGFELPGIKFL